MTTLPQQTKFTIPELIANYIIIHKVNIDTAAEAIGHQYNIYVTTVDKAKAVSIVLRTQS